MALTKSDKIVKNYICTLHFFVKKS